MSKPFPIILDMRLSQASLMPDYSISRVIKGAWQLSAGHSLGAQASREQMLGDMHAFVERGITTFDFGDIYVGVEELVGDYLARLRQEQGDAARSSIQLHTKYVPDIDHLATHSFADAERIIHRSLHRLGVESLDLVQFHWWDYSVQGYVGALQDLARVQREGCIRLLGVTNFDVERMNEFTKAGVTPATIQLQYSLLDRRPENGMSAFCAEHGIQMLCYGTVAGGFLSDRYLGIPEPQPPFENRSLIKYKLIIDEFGGWEKFQALLQTLHHIAGKHQCSISTIASAYVLSRPQVAAVIVGAKDGSHLEENACIMELRLDASDLALIEKELSTSPGPKGDVYDLERNDPKHAGIMHRNNNRK